MKLVFYRILGNDLPPRHDPDQTLKNVRFILENEPDLEHCEKRYLLNRIVNQEKVARLKELLGNSVDEIPFNPEVYRNLPEDQWARIHYLTNVNSARNACVRLGRAKYGGSHVLPSDGSCIMQPEGWQELVQSIAQNPETAYFAMPTWRMGENSKYWDTPDRECLYWAGGKKVKSPAEPQVVFGPNADVLFNENLPYARVDKVELLWRIGLRGRWDNWEPGIRKMAEARPSAHFGKCIMTSVICRLGANTSDVQQEHDNMRRGKFRHEGMRRLVQQVNALTGS